MVNYLKRNFNTIVNIATFIAIIALISFFSYKWFFPQGSSSQNREDLAVGKHLSDVSELNEDKYERSIILVLNTNCKYCNESMGFYKKLANSNYDKNTRQLVALFPQHLEVVNKYKNDRDFLVRGIGSVEFDKLKFELTPTIVAINSDRQILKSWFGMLKPEQEQEVINILKH